MTIKTQLNESMKDAMKSGDEVRKRTVRMVLAAVNIPEDNGRRARMPTFRRCASWKNKFNGRWRKRLKMICTVCTCEYSIAFNASSTFSTLTP